MRLHVAIALISSGLLLTTAVPLRERRSDESSSSEVTEFEGIVEKAQTNLLQLKEKKEDSKDVSDSVEHDLLSEMVKDDLESNQDEGNKSEDSHSEEEDKKTVVKRSPEIPDDYQHKCHDIPASIETNDLEHYEYTLKQKYGHHKLRFRRDESGGEQENEINRRRREVLNTVDDKSSSESSEEKDTVSTSVTSEPAPINQKKRNVVDKSSSEEDSSEEKLAKGQNGAPGKEGGGQESSVLGVEKAAEGGVGETKEAVSVVEAGSTVVKEAIVRRRRNVENPTSHFSEEAIEVLIPELNDSLNDERPKDSGEADVMTKSEESSVEDYAQGCEVMDANSYEVNETTYAEDKRKRRSIQEEDDSLQVLYSEILEEPSLGQAAKEERFRNIGDIRKR